MLSMLLARRCEINEACLSQSECTASCLKCSMSGLKKLPNNKNYFKIKSRLTFISKKGPKFGQDETHLQSVSLNFVNKKKLELLETSFRLKRVSCQMTINRNFDSIRFQQVLIFVSSTVSCFTFFWSDSDHKKASQSWWGLKSEKQVLKHCYFPRQECARAQALD